MLEQNPGCHSSLSWALYWVLFNTILGALANMFCTTYWPIFLLRAPSLSHRGDSVFEHLKEFKEGSQIRLGDDFRANTCPGLNTMHAADALFPSGRRSRMQSQPVYVA